MTSILLTGGTGFLGEYVLRHLIASDVDVRVFVRETSDVTCLKNYEIDICYGDLENISTIEQALQDVDLLINLASLGFGYAPNIVEACVNSGISRAIFVSSTSIFSKLNAPTKSQRIQSELMIAESGLSFTIIRPTMIYGSPRDRNIWKLIEFINRWSVVPVIGGGRALQQPVYVNDVAQCIVNAIHCDHSIGKSYNIAGSEPLSYLDIIDVISTGIGSNVKKIYCPVIVARIAAQLFGGIGLRITEEQVLRFEENKVIDNSSAIEQLGYSPLDFEQGLGFELQWLDK